MHFWMGITLIVAVIITQVLIVVWKEWHYNSYRQFTMWGEYSNVMCICCCIYSNSQTLINKGQYSDEILRLYAEFT